jgi:FdrA protein
VTDRVVLRRNTYFDSVTLMLASRAAEEIGGVEFAAAVAATPVNLELLAEQGFDLSTAGLGPNDMVVAVRAADEAVAETAVEMVETSLQTEPAGVLARPETAMPRSLRSAARSDPSVNVAFVSVPGRYAAYEVAAALEAGLHVFCFSDDMPLSHEAALKQRAVEKGLLFMGADCGTAVINGVGFGFANTLQRGPVGLIGASGTGIQQVACMLDYAGIGISHAIGVGGRDLSAAVGGTMTLHAIELLAEDDTTELIAVLSKPPDPEVARRVAARAAKAGKPVILGFLGRENLDTVGGVEITASLEGAALVCARLCGRSLELEDTPLPEKHSPGEIRGLFCGGSLCHEAAQIVHGRDPRATFLDYGEPEYTQGRAHPMIDPSLRNRRFESDARDPAVGAIVLDVVLGYGANSDPASDLAPRIERSLQNRNGELGVVVALCGTGGDPQDLLGQEKALTEAGALVTRNAAHAGRLALAVTGSP